MNNKIEKMKESPLKITKSPLRGTVFKSERTLENKILLDAKEAGKENLNFLKMYKPYILIIQSKVNTGILTPCCTYEMYSLMYRKQE